MIKKVIIIGANEFQKELIIEAKKNGYETHVFAWEDGAVAKEDADCFYPISITEKEKIFEIANKIRPSGVMSIASDLAVPTVNYIGNRLKIIANSNFCTLVSTNKYEMRKVLTKNNLPCPKYYLVDENCETNKLEIEYPAIIKPIDRSGSRGINKIESSKVLKDAIINAKSVSFSDKVLIEEYVEGKEYSIEMISYKGEHHFLAITEKFTTGAPNFIETAHLQPARIDEKIKLDAIDIIKKALDVLDIKNGASHSEFKVDQSNNIKIIEIGSRMGGDCIGSDLVEISTGFDFKKMVIDVACGEAPSLLKKHTRNNIAFIKFIFNEEDLNLLNRIRNSHPETIHRISNIGEIGSEKILDSSTRCGYFILKCCSVEECLKLVNNDSSI